MSASGAWFPNRFVVVFVAAAILLQACSTVDYAGRSRGAAGASPAGLPNFGKVDEHLYRGAQPTDAGIAKLAALHIKTIVDLLPPSERWAAEAAAAESCGIRYCNGVQLSGIASPRDADVDRVLAIVDDPKQQPVFVHCVHGKDRTGTIVACHRMKQGWSAARAQQEADRYGMSRLEFGMRSYIRNYPARLQKVGKAVHSPLSIQRS